VTIVDVPALFCWSALQRLSYSVSLKKPILLPFLFRVGGTVKKTSIAPDDMVQEPAPVSYGKPIFEPVLSFQPTSLKDQYLDEHAGVAVIALYQVVANKT
jgi:hypothetical protein